MVKQFFFLLVLLFTQIAYAQDFNCQSPLMGKTLTFDELDEMLDKHPNLCGTTLQGLDLHEMNFSRFNFSGSDLSQTKLQNANFSESILFKTYFRNANLTGTNFQNANMQQSVLELATADNADFRQAILYQSNLIHANLKNTNFMFANLNHAIFSAADLSNADLRWADLSHADLSYANLTNANLENANLSNAILDKTILTNANLSQTNFKNTIFQPHLRGLPDLITLSTANNFNTIQFEDFNNGKASLTELRAAYKDLGIRSMERNITAIIKYKEMITNWQNGGWGYLESAFNYLFFYLTCNYGANPGRPLKIFLIGIFLFAIPYRFALSHSTKHAGITAIWTPNRFVRWNKPHTIIYPQEQLSIVLRCHHTYYSKNFIRRQIHLMNIALFFSFLSACTIGWREINISNWVSRLQPRDYLLKGKGWVRSLVGIQSVLSAYLVVLWVITYFGRPFEW